MTDRNDTLSSARSVREIVSNLRVRVGEYRHRETSLEQWRQLQLDILAVARMMPRIARDRGEWPDHAREALWVMLGDAFWMEQDITSLIVRIEAVIDEIARHDAD